MPKPWIEIPPLELTRNPGKWPMLELTDSSTSEEEEEDNNNEQVDRDNNGDDHTTPKPKPKPLLLIVPLDVFMSGEFRNWAELPHDVLSLIFKKIAAFEILLRAQFVCKPWRQLSMEPGTWRMIDICSNSDWHIDIDDDEEIDLTKVAKTAVDRSQGQLEELWIDDREDVLLYAAERTSHLRCLRLLEATDISDEGLVEAVSRFPFLEDLDITLGEFDESICKSVGQACPHLRCFRLNSQGSRSEQYKSDVEALGIADNMPELRHLQLIGNQVTNKGLSAILEKCVHLESLDLRCCFHVNFNASIQEKCTRIKKVRLPNDPTDDYGFEAEMERDTDTEDDENEYLDESDPDFSQMTYEQVMDYFRDDDYDDDYRW